MTETKKNLKKVLNYTLLLSALIILVAQSPAALLSIYEEQSEINPNMLKYLYLQSAYFYFVTIFSVIAYFRFNKDRFLEKSAFYIWIYSLFYLFTRIPYGFDVTDQGYHLSNSWAMLSDNISNNMGLTWLTSLSNGIWLKIVRYPSVIWARIGYAIIVSLIIYFSLKIAYLYIRKSYLIFISFLIVSLFYVRYNYYLTINYDNLPVIVLLISLFLMLSSVKKEKPPILISILSGVLLGIATFMKFSMILSAFIPVLIFLEQDCDMKRKLKQILPIFYGMFGTLFIGFILMIITGLFNEFSESFGNIVFQKHSIVNSEQISSNDHNITGSYIGNDIYDLNPVDSIENKPEINTHLFTNPGNINTPARLFKLYSYHTWIFASRTPAILCLIIIMHFLFFLLNSKYSKFIIVLLFGAVIAISFKHSFSEYPIALFSIILAILFMGLDSKNTLGEYKTLILCSLSLFVVSFAGSNLSFNTAFRSGGAVLLTFVAVGVSNKKIRIPWLDKTLDLKYNIMLLLVIMIFSVNSALYLSTHRDMPRKYLTQMFASDELFGVFSNYQRVQVVDELIEFVKSTETKNKKAVFVGHLPMFYYLLDKEPVIRNPWIEVGKSDYVLTFESLQGEDLPPLVVISKVNAKSNFWPIDGSFMDGEHDIKWKEYFEYFVIKNDYLLSFENDMFLVYIKEPQY